MPSKVWIRDRAAALLRGVVPKRVRYARFERRARAYENKSPQERFSRIYRDRAWGRDFTSDFYSGRGSHDPSVWGGYVDAVRSFIGSIGDDVTVVDLGCGDFNIGQRLRSAAGTYIACDVVPELVESHRATYASLDVEFLHVDLVSDELPPGQVGIIREVFQHLPNEEIASIVPKLAVYDWLLVTEELPQGKFRANSPKGTGVDVRSMQDPASGVDIALPPFSLGHVEATVLHEAEARPGVIRTTAYRIAV